MACTTGCPTQDCESYGACLKGKGARVAYCNSAGGLDYTAQKSWDKELDAYKSARAEGIQPAGTKLHQVENAKRISDAAGSAWSAA
jgi:hypothetical protein